MSLLFRWSWSCACTPAPVPTDTTPQPTPGGDTADRAPAPRSSSIPDAPWPDSPGAEAIVWYTTASGARESIWLREGTDGHYEVIATRPEAVVSDGRELWVMRAIELPTTGGEVGERLRPMGLKLVAFTLMGETRLPEWADGESYDDVPTLLGSIGPRIVVHSSGAEAVHDGTERFERRRIARLEAAPRAAECVRGDASTAEYQREPEGLVEQLAALEAARAGAGTTDPRSAPLSLLPAEGAARAPSRAVVAALRERASSGPLGFAFLAFSTPEDRACTRAAFDRVSEPAVVDPSRPELRAWTRAVELANHGPREVALEAFDGLIARNPELGRAWLGRAHMKRLGGDLVGAKRDLEAALTRDQPPELARDVRIELALVAEAAGDRTEAIERFEELWADDSWDRAISAKLDALGPGLRYLEKGPDNVIARWPRHGFPAIDATGTRIARVVGDFVGPVDDAGLLLEVRRVKDNRVVATLPAYRFKEIQAGVDTVVTRLHPVFVKRAAAIDALLRDGAWRALSRHEEERNYESNHDLPFVFDDGAVVVDYVGEIVTIDVASESQVFQRRMSLDRHTDDGFTECFNSAFLGVAHHDRNLGVALLTFRYTGNDTCYEPADAVLALRWPTAAAHAGWRAVARPPTRAWLETLAAELLAPDDGKPLSAAQREEITAFVTRWSNRFPRAPAIVRMQQALAR